LRGGRGELLLMNEAALVPRPVRKRSFGLNRRRDSGGLWGIDLCNRRSTPRRREDWTSLRADRSSITAFSLHRQHAPNALNQGCPVVGRRARSSAPRAALHDGELGDVGRQPHGHQDGPHRACGRKVSTHTICPRAHAGQSRSDMPVSQSQVSVSLGGFKSEVQRG